MRPKLFLFHSIFFLLLLLCSEILLRFALVFYGFPFFKPSDYIFNGFYPNVKTVAQKQIRSDDNVKDILILGGSVVSTQWSNLEIRLNTMLRKAYGQNRKFAFYNVAFPGHTSLDNLIKYKLLDHKRFDLVIYYEAINENRANNIPPEAFAVDYSHFRWYRDIHLLRAHPEINFTVLPYIVHKFFSAMKDEISGRQYLGIDGVDPNYVHFGGDIKSGKSFRRHIDEIIKTAQSRGDRLLLLSYASYFPDNVTLCGGESDKQYFAKCKSASSVSIWGNPRNVEKGIKVHNAAITELVNVFHVPFLNMKDKMPKDPAFFCDVCHLSEAGAEKFSSELAKFIIEKRMLD